MPRSSPTQSKAIQLLAEGRLAPLAVPVQAFAAIGSRGENYRVFVGPGTSVCTCPAPRECKHLDAAVAWVNATDEERAVMVQALAERKARDAAVAEDAFARLAA